MNRSFSVFFILFYWSTLALGQNEAKALVENYQKLGPDEAVRSILIDKQNYKWLGTDKGLYRMISMDHEPEFIVQDSIMGLAEDKKEILWYGNRQQQLQTEDGSQNIILGNAKPQISSMAYYKGDLWVGTDQGLFRVSDDQSKILNHYTVSNSKLQSNQINSLYADQDERLWVGTDAGIAKIHKKDWDYYEKQHRFTGAIATSEG
ncbi:MAG TPA: two-component regulator propeller domain-containing protein, partial [Saprospiraceae bacterium]|nr:two-component regulator propeller domain-containing protein [Saprospiraceae bacterium]